jgi:hypothetical protein
MTLQKYAKQVKGIKTLEEFKVYEKEMNNKVENIHNHIQANKRKYTFNTGIWRDTSEILPDTDERPFIIDGLKKKGYEFRDCGKEWRF